MLCKQQQKPGSWPPSAPPTPKKRARYPDPAWEGNLLSPYVHEQTVLCDLFFFPLLFFVLKRHWLLYWEGAEDFPALGAVPDSFFSALTQRWEGSITFNPLVFYTLHPHPTLQSSFGPSSPYFSLSTPFFPMIPQHSPPFPTQAGPDPSSCRKIPPHEHHTGGALDKPDGHGAAGMGF